jgi:hypothetical protein
VFVNVNETNIQHGCTGADCDFLLTPIEMAERLRVPAS